MDSPVQGVQCHRRRSVRLYNYNNAGVFHSKCRYLGENMENRTQIFKLQIQCPQHVIDNSIRRFFLSHFVLRESSHRLR